MNRRKFLATTGAVAGAAALAGCGDNPIESAPQHVPTADHEVEGYIVASLAYQNQLIHSDAPDQDKPEMSFDPDSLDEVWKYVVTSLRWQNDNMEGQLCE